MDVLYANCFGAPQRDVLITNEPSVAQAAPGRLSTVLADERYDPDVAQQINAQLAELAYSWTSLDDRPDPTLWQGVSAADLAGTEALVALLQPVARGVLDAKAVLGPGSALGSGSVLGSGKASEAKAALGGRPSLVTVAVPKTSDPRFDRVERTIGEGFAAACGVSVGWANVADPRNEALVAKYAQTRNPPLKPSEGVKAQALAKTMAGAVNALSRLRGRGPVRVLVVDYHPTAAFARVYRANGGGPFGLMRLRYGRRDLAAMAKAGDRALAPLGGARAARRGAVRQARGDAGMERALAAYVERHDDELKARFAVAGVDLWRIVGERMVELALDYGAWMKPRVGRVRRALLAGRVGAVLVPFEGPPEARLVLRLAQALEIPTLMINDGWRGDDHLQDGMAADRALAWSSSIARNYFGRRRHGLPTIVTGNPRSDEATPLSRTTQSSGGPAQAPRASGKELRRVLVGSLAFSPSDLNCRRSDPERFLAEVLEGIAASVNARGAYVLVKLHPADRPEVYEAVVERFAGLDLEIRDHGDVLGLFDQADLYITTYSTSLLEAAAVGLPVLYYRVNRQRLHAPFSGEEETMAARTASSPQELAALLDAPQRLALPKGAALASWVQEHLGPTDGRCTERVAAALAADARLRR